MISEDANNKLKQIADKGNISRWFYQIGDSDVFFTFKYSYETGKIEEWKMQKWFSYSEWSFAGFYKAWRRKSNGKMNSSNSGSRERYADEIQIA